MMHERTARRVDRAQRWPAVSEIEFLSLYCSGRREFIISFLQDITDVERIQGASGVQREVVETYMIQCGT